MAKKTIVYLDNCCFNRPYDDPLQPSIRLEIQAKLMVQAAIQSQELQLVWSFILDFENAANPYHERRETIADWKNLATVFIGAEEAIRLRAKRFESIGIKSKDALHLACAISANSDYFLTTDKKLIQKGLQIKGLKIINPIDFIIQEEANHET